MLEICKDDVVTFILLNINGGLTQLTILFYDNSQST